MGNVMPIARKEIVSEGIIGIYHCITRCVRRAFLCGSDAYTGRSYEHRKTLIKHRLQLLADVFAVDVFAYAVMSNHLHIVIRNRPDIVENWTDEEVALQWLKVFPSGGKFDNPLDINKEAAGLARNQERIVELRGRLSSVSWFMRCLNEYIARQANKEDECKGRFWDGRFKCQALLDESAVLTCMAYVDLNPIRAGIAETPETSFFTSIYERIVSRQNDINNNFNEKSVNWLTPFMDEAGNDHTDAIDMQLDEYMNLVDWTGRQIRDGKASIPDHLTPILSRLSIDECSWVGTVQDYGGLFHRAVGRLDSMVKAAQEAGLRWLGGVTNCAKAFSPA